MTTLRYQNVLSIRQGGKNVPYGGFGERRADGEANYGFQNLKRNPAASTMVPELNRDPALLALANALNAEESGFFSVGCTSGPIVDDNGHRWTGYMEFAINSQERVADAANYFPMFLHFDRFLAKVQSELEVQYHWELMGAHFSDARCMGFTGTIFVNTHYVASRDLALTNWNEALSLCAAFFDDYLGTHPDPIYTIDG
jgi:hypothetical protein